MRLDKFLKVSRLVKRRAVANDLCRAGHVLVNGRPAKPASRLAAGDVIEIDLAPRRLRVEVLPAAAADRPAPNEELFRHLDSPGVTPLTG